MYSREMRIGATSDLHGILPEIEPCELFFICGDIMPLSVQLNMPASLEWLKTEFIPWANNLPCKHVIFIAGNHWLADEIMRKQPDYCFCGHIHSGNHELQEITGIHLANVSLVGEDYNIHYEPLYLNI